MSEDTRAEVRNLVDAWVRAVDAANVEGAVSLFAPDPALFDVGFPFRQNGTDALRARLKEWMDGYAPAKGPGFSMKDLEVVASDEAGYAFGLNHITGELKNGQPVDMWVRTTLGLRKIDGAWKITHEHMSVPIDFETMKASFDAQPEE